MTQKARVLQFMKDHGSISQAEADRIKVRRLAPRILDLRADGVAIASHTEYGKNEYGKFHYTRYSLEG